MSAQPLWGHPVYAPQRFSAQDLLTLPEDGNKYELYQGVIITMPPPEEYHGNVSVCISSSLFVHLKQIGKKNCLTENAGFDLTIPGQPDTVLAPDIAVTATPATRGSGYRKTPPLLAVEIVSPSQSRPEMVMKAQFYLSAGVQMVWIVWPNSRTVDVWTAAQQVTTLAEHDTISGGTVLPGFSCPISEFFA